MANSSSSSLLPDKLEGLLRERYLRDPIPGFRLPSERQLAGELEVSVPTLRKAVERLVAEGVLERRRGSGTFVRSRGKDGASALLAKPIAILCNADLATVFQPHLLLQPLSDCRQLLHQRNYRVRTYLGDEQSEFHPDYAVPAEFLTDVRNDVLGGVIALGTFPCASWMGLLEERRVPVVGIGELYHHMVTENYMIYLLQAARRLAELGRTRVAYIQGSPFQGKGDASFHQGKSHVYDDQTVRCLLEGFGLTVQENWFRNEWRCDSPGAGWSALREIWSGKNRPDGLIVANPILAEDVCLAAREGGIRVPEDLVIVGSWMKGTPTPPPSGMETIFSDRRLLSENLVEMLDEAVRTGSISRPRRIINCLETQASDLPAALAATLSESVH